MGTLLAVGVVAVVALIVLGVIVALIMHPGAGAEEVPELPSVPITTVAEHIKIDGLMMLARKEPTADLVQLLTNLGVTPEMMSKVIIEVETPES